MTETNTTFFKLRGGYTLTRLNSSECTLIFRNPENNVLATMSGCGDKINAVNLYRDNELSPMEKKLLQYFVRRQKLMLTEEAAAALDLSVLRYDDGREEYLSENALRNRLREPLDAAYLYVGKLKQNTLNVANYSRSGHYNLSRAQIKKLNVGHNCDLLIDLRDNEYIETVHVADSFNGGVNLSRSSIENITIDNNCRCDLAVFESKKCFSLDIADVYSGNMNIKNSCFHNLNVGYYSYATIRLADNWGRRDVVIGDSFRGSLNLDGVNTNAVRIGKDCKGLIKIASTDKNQSSRKIEIGDDFNGVLDVRGASNVAFLQVGQRAGGKFNLWGAEGIRRAEFGAYFSGYADFSESAIEYITLAAGSSGELIMQNCRELKLLKMPKYQNSNLSLSKDPLDMRADATSSCYLFSPDVGSAECYPPLYRKIYNGMKEMFSSRFN